MTIVEAAPGITGGVDTHLDKHVAAALDPLGRLVGTESFNADAAGYKALLIWLEEFGQIESLLLATAPDLMARFGVGPDTAASLLVAAGDNPERLHSEAAWAHLCGVSPVPADSGKNAGHRRRHDGGDRQANSALWRIAMVRIAHDPETTAYFDRRVKEGRTKRDVIRILQRYIAREVYRYLPHG